MDTDRDKLQSTFESLSKDLGDGFVASEIWAIEDGQPVIKNHRYNNNPHVAPLFNKVTQMLYKTLEKSDYPGLGNYYLISLDNQHLAVVLTIGKLQQFVLINLQKTPIGLLMSVALPNLLSILANDEAGVEDPAGHKPEDNFPETGKTDSPGRKSSLREIFSALTGGMYYPDKPDQRA